MFGQHTAWRPPTGDHGSGKTTLQEIIMKLIESLVAAVSERATGRCRNGPRTRRPPLDDASPRAGNAVGGAFVPYLP